MGLFCRWIIRRLRRDLADTSDEEKGDALIGFKQPYPGATGRTVHEKLSEILSVKDFGSEVPEQPQDCARRLCICAL